MIAISRGVVPLLLFAKGTKEIVKVYHQFRKELHIMSPKGWITSSRKRDTAPEGLMKYKGGLQPLMICTTLRATM